MKTWIIEPRDPLIVRDGRPFGATPGARATSLPFPFPSTISGGLRERSALNEQGVFSLSGTSIFQLLKIAVRGPFLVELSPEGQIKEWLFPAPNDALLLEPSDDKEKKGQNEPAEEEKQAQVIRKALHPFAPPPGSISNLPAGLEFVRMSDYDPRKPSKNAPHFWYWNQLQTWLMRAQDDAQPIKRDKLGHNGPQSEQRMHVRIKDESQIADKGYLFQTKGLEFRRNQAKTLTLPPNRLALAVATATELAPGFAPLGGERRLVSWQQTDQTLPSCPDQIKAQISQQKQCRLLLATPACFQNGYQPTWLLEPRLGVTPGVKAIAIGRPQIISGWDLLAKRPKPTRRLAPAGSVYFLNLAGNPSDIAQWVDEIWLHCISDSAQDRQDGFGVALLGTWQDETTPDTEGTA